MKNGGALPPCHFGAAISGSDRAQSLLLPASVEDYVGEDNPVRAIEAFVDGFDLAKAGFVRAQAKDTGRRGYHPGDLLKLYLYGYLRHVMLPRMWALVPSQRRNRLLRVLELTPDDLLQQVDFGI